MSSVPISGWLEQVAAAPVSFSHLVAAERLAAKAPDILQLSPAALVYPIAGNAVTAAAIAIRMRCLCEMLLSGNLDRWVIKPRRRGSDWSVRDAVYIAAAKAPLSGDPLRIHLPDVERLALEFIGTEGTA